MSLDEIECLVKTIEENLKRDLVLESGFQGVNTGEERYLQKELFFIIFTLNIIRHFILSCLCFFPLSETSKLIRIVCVDLLYGLGPFGCLMNQIYLSGQICIWQYLLTIKRQEKAGQLEVFTHIKNFRRFKLNEAETVKFTGYLKGMAILRRLVFCLSTIPLTGIFVLGTYITATQLQDIRFVILSIPVNLAVFSINYYGLAGGSYALLITGHSSNYLGIRFDRVFGKMKSFLVHDMPSVAQTSRDTQSTSRMKHLNVKTKIGFKEIEDILCDAEDVLFHVKLHDHTVKDFLRSSVTYLIPVMGLHTVFLAQKQELIYKLLDANTAILNGFLLYYTFHSVSHIHSLSVMMCKKLHNLHFRVSSKNQRIHLLHLIQRTSDCKTWNLPIGFTIGGQTSFSPVTVLSSFSRVISIALTFLNAQSTWNY